MNDRIRPLKSIKKEEEYESYKKILERYLSEYRLFQEHGDKYHELIADSSDLKPRERLIKNGEYAQALERNITAYMLTIDEYEAKNENRSLFDVIRGIVTKDEDTRDYLKRRYMKSRAEDNGLLEPVDLNLQDPYDSVRQIFEEYEFINIQPPEMSLIPVDAKVNELFREVKEMLTECLKENGIVVVSGESQKTTEKSIKETTKISNQTRVVNITKEASKGKDEIGDEI